MIKLFRILFLTSIIFNIVLLLQDDESLITSLKTKVLDLEEKVLKLKSENRRLRNTDRLNFKQAAIKKTQPNFQESVESTTQKTFKEQLPKKEESEINDEDVMLEEKAYQEESEKFFKQAHAKIAEFLEIKVGLTPDQMNLYSFLKEQRSHDIERFIKKRMSDLQKEGDSTFMLSMEDTIEIGKINQSYLERFKKNIGPEAYDRYRKYKREFNREMASDPNNMFPFIVEF